MAEYMNISSVFLGIFISVIFLYWWSKNRKLNLPPSGPWCLPLVGYLPFLGKEPHIVFKKLSEKYGKVYSLYLGRSYTIVLNDYQSVKDAFSNNAILDRPPKMFDFYPDGLGFAGQNGAEWIEQRRFTMRTLKDIGMSRIPWEADVETEIEDFLKILEKEDGKPVDISQTLLSSTSNNMTSIVLGKRLETGGPERKIVDDGMQAVIDAFANDFLVFLFPDLLKYIAKMGLAKYAKIYKKMVTFNNFFKKEIENRKKISSSHSEDIYIDGYLKEIQKTKENNTKTFYNDINLIGSAQTVVVGGSETTKQSILWLLLAMAAYKEVQDKVQEEIDRVLGREGKLKWSERARLPYTYATTMEGLRWRTVSPLGVLHRASEDTKIGEFDVPKDTNVLSNIWALHNDPVYWNEPESFIPERFLQKDGKLIPNKLQSYLPFSIGRRMCPGEIVVVMEVFRYFTFILQRFRVCPGGDAPPNLDGILTATFQPIPQELRFVPRE